MVDAGDDQLGLEVRRSARARRAGRSPPACRRRRSRRSRRRTRSPRPTAAAGSRSSAPSPTGSRRARPPRARCRRADRARAAASAALRRRSRRRWSAAPAARRTTLPTARVHAAYRHLWCGFMVRKPSGVCAVLLVGGALLVTLGVLGALRPRRGARRARVRRPRDGGVRLRRGAGRGRRRGSRSARSTPSRRSPRCGRRSTPRSPPSSQSWQFPERFHAGATAMHRALFSGGAGRSDAARHRRRAGARPRRRSRASRELLPHEDLAALPARQRRDARVRAGRGRSGAPSASRACARWPLLAGLALLGGLGLAGADAPPRGPPGGARHRARGRRDRRGDHGRPRAIVLSTFDTGHGDAVVGQIWDAFLGDLRVVGPRLRGGRADRGRGLRAGRARRVAAARGRACGEPCGSVARLARAVALFVLAALLLWMPEVPLDLALVSLAGVLVFTRRRRGRAFVVRSVVVTRIRLSGRLTGRAHPSSASQCRTNARSPGASSAGCSSIGAIVTTILPLLPGANGKVLTPTLPIGIGAALWGLHAALRMDWRNAPRLGHPRGRHRRHLLRRGRHADTGGASSPARFLLMLVLVYAAYFFPPREAWPYLGLVVAVHALPLAYDPDDARARRRAADPRPLLRGAGVAADPRQARDGQRAGQRGRARAPGSADRRWRTGARCSRRSSSTQGAASAC